MPLDLETQPKVNLIKARLERAWKIMTRWNPDQQTSEQGYLMSDPETDAVNHKHSQPYSRRSLIKELLEIYADNPVVLAALIKLAEDAVSNGYTVTIKDAATDEIGYRAERNFQRLKEQCRLEEYASSFAFSAVGFGDSYLQPVVDYTGQIVAVRDMPTEAIIRNTDARDQFIDPQKAFIFRTSDTDREADYFYQSQIMHWRWRHRPGQRYGNALLFPGRSLSKDSIAALRSLLPRRLANQPFRHLNILGPTGKGIAASLFQSIKKNLSRLVHIQKGGQISPFDDVFTNNIEVAVKGGDPQQGELKDIEFMLDAVLVLTGISRQLLGWNVTGNRFTLDETRKEAYAHQRKIARGLVTNHYKPLHDLSLSLEDISPNQVSYEVIFDDQMTESEMERRVQQSREDFKLGLVTLAEARQLRGSYYLISKVDEGTRELEQINTQQPNNPIAPTPPTPQPQE